MGSAKKAQKRERTCISKESAGPSRFCGERRRFFPSGLRRISGGAGGSRVASRGQVLSGRQGRDASGGVLRSALDDGLRVVALAGGRGGVSPPGRMAALTDTPVLAPPPGANEPGSLSQWALIRRRFLGHRLAVG